MLINSIPFLFFFTIVFCLYYWASASVKMQNLLILLASMFFYGYANVEMLSLLVASIVLFFYLGKKIQTSSDASAKVYTSIGVCIGVGLLLYFKYTNFFLQSFIDLFDKVGMHVGACDGLAIVLPLGISFFTFRLISYLLDVRQGRMAQASLMEFAIYVSFFPCLLSGPIDRAVTFIPQLRHNRTFNYPLAVEGCRQIIWGAFKKMVVADGLSLFVTKDVATSNGSTLLIVAVMYSIQIYADFSGYSDMAIGVGKLLGIKITRNFHYPYFSRNVAEFWNRWHMSLLLWFRYYIYIPLGGGKVSKIKVIRNTFIVFIVSGLWHGANWTFVVWGLFHGLLFVPSLIGTKRKRYKEETPYVAQDVLKCIVVFVLITFGWILFRSDSITEFVMNIKTICSPSLFDKPVGVAWALYPMIFASFMFLLEWIKKQDEFPLANLNCSKGVRWGLYMLLIVAIIFYQGKPVDFIYFKF